MSNFMFYSMKNQYKEKINNLLTGSGENQDFRNWHPLKQTNKKMDTTFEVQLFDTVNFAFM